MQIGHYSILTVHVGFTPLRHAALKGNYDVMCALLADKAVISDDVWVAVHAGGHQNCIRLLEVEYMHSLS